MFLAGHVVTAQDLELAKSLSAPVALKDLQFSRVLEDHV